MTLIVLELSGKSWYPLENEPFGVHLGLSLRWHSEMRPRLASKSKFSYWCIPPNHAEWFSKMAGGTTIYLYNDLCSLWGGKWTYQPCTTCFSLNASRSCELSPTQVCSCGSYHRHIYLCGSPTYKSGTVLQNSSVGASLPPTFCDEYWLFAWWKLIFIKA